MPVVQDFENLLKATDEMEAKRPDLFRLKRLLDEKKQKGILFKKPSKVPTLQETERYGYETFFARQSS